LNLVWARAKINPGLTASSIMLHFPYTATANDFMNYYVPTGTNYQGGVFKDSTENSSVIVNTGLDK